MSPANTPINQTQTRRMVERQASNGSNAPRGRSRGNNMVRRSSSASMTERTFRDPSPGRPATAQGVASTSRQSEPPVPKVPDNYTKYNNIPPVPQKASRRSASIDEYQMRKDAAARKVANRSSVPQAPAVKPSTNPGLAAARRVTSGSDSPQLTRTDSNNSHNFSYPNRARPTSPPPQSPQLSGQPPRPTAAKAAGSPVSVTPKGISQTEVQQIKNNVVQAAQQPVKKKKGRTGPLSEGSHLQTGTMGQKPVVTPLAPGLPPQEPEPADNIDNDPNIARLAGQGSHFPASPTSPTDSQGSLSDSEKSQTRRKQRASGALQKQPSVVREDWEGEQEDGFSSAEPSPAANKISSLKSHTTEANVSRKIEGSVAKPDQKPAEALPAAVANLRTPEPRQPSLSPSRSTRFSSRLSADMTEGQKHEPPPRSVSPRKSVLKHSPSMKAQAADANRQRESSLSPSEATDISLEGNQRPKKSAHVKFDTHPSVVGVAAEPQTPISDSATSPQYRTDKSWFGLKKSPNRVWLSEDSDDEDAMKPRPMLPTFGSVRGGRRNDSEQSTGQKPLSSPSSSSASSFSSGTAPRTMDTSISSDHAIGGLISREAQENQKQITQGSPLPPQVTSVEGSGMHSDTDSIYSQSEPRTVMQQPNAVPSQDVSGQSRVGSTAPLHDIDEVPAIAVQPATPGEDEIRAKDNWLYGVPGGFPSSAQELDSTEIQSPPARTTNPQNIKTTYTSIHDAVTAPEVVPSERYSELHDLPQTSHDRMPAIEEESDRDSVYSDAAEEMDGDGFGSIAAIMHSPVPPSPVTQTHFVDSPTTAPPDRDIQEEAESPSDWDRAGARWKDHLENVKRASLQPAAPIVEGQQPRASKVSQSQAPAKIAARASPKTLAQTNQSARSQQQQQPGLKKSMRGQADNTGPTMRNRGQNSNNSPQPLRSSMRNSAPQMPVTVSLQSPNAGTGTLQKKSLRAPVAQVNQQRPPLVNNDSDSESSFRRRRRAKSTESGKNTMRRSMRAGSDSAPSVPNVQAGRATSPVERRPFSPVNGATSMRTTMRGSMDNTPTLRGSAGRGSIDNTPTLRGNQGKEKRSSSLFGRKKANDLPPRPMSSAGFDRSRIGADSDDEDAKRQAPFKSRFGDSSDEDEEGLRPVRGIPKTNRDDDSTDLEDSSDEEKRKRTSRPAMPSSPQQSNRPMSPTSPDGKKKRGFFGRMKKNKDEPASPKVEATPVTAQQQKKVKPPKQGAETAALGFRSDAEKEALIEQTRQRLEAANQPPSPARAMSPSPGTPGKLQRRHTPQRIMSDSWPLPPKIPDDVESQNVSRPMTSDGTAPAKRPDLERNPSSATSPASPGGSSNDVYGKAGKKKRFPMLRKAFGLKD